jgi:hypothetical protein
MDLVAAEGLVHVEALRREGLRGAHLAQGAPQGTLGGSQPMECSSCAHARAASGTERVEKAALWCWRTS